MPLRCFVARISGVIILVTGLMGCQSANVQFPEARLLSPENSGVEERFKLGFSYGSAREVEFVSDASKRPLRVDGPIENYDTTVTGYFSGAIFDQLEVGIQNLSVQNSPTVFYAKFQILGVAENKAKAGDVSLAVTGGIAHRTFEKSGDQDGTFGRGGNNWQSRVHLAGRDVSMILGYRPGEGALLYSGVQHSTYGVEVSIHQDRADDGSSPEANYNEGFQAEQVGGHLGVRLKFGRSGHFMIEGGRTVFRMSRIPDRTTTMGTAALGFGF